MAQTNVVIGTLRHRLTLEQLSLTDDGQGGRVESWTPVSDLWASLTSNRAGDRVEGDRIVSDITYDITIRYRTDITSGMRFRKGSRIFFIQSVRDPDGCKILLSCKAQEDNP